LIYAALQLSIEKSNFKLPIPILSNPTGSAAILIADKIEIIPFNDNRYGTSSILYALSSLYSLSYKIIFKIDI
jgi:hypothetical protein